jgi:hypothetical protein
MHKGSSSAAEFGFTAMSRHLGGSTAYYVCLFHTLTPEPTSRGCQWTDTPRQIHRGRLGAMPKVLDLGWPALSLIGGWPCSLHLSSPQDCVLLTCCNFSPSASICKLHCAESVFIFKAAIHDGADAAYSSDPLTVILRPSQSD